MTIIVSVKINDGIVMAADSAGTMDSGHVYVHANKITNLCEGLPIAAMSTGSGGIGGIEFIRAGRRKGDAAITNLSRAILGTAASRKSRQKPPISFQ